jgi:capsular exopolysaccharide synthesis family protein
MSMKKTILMSSGSSDGSGGHSATASALAAVSPSSVARKSHPAPNALALLKALRRRWLLAATCGLLASTLAAAGVWFGMPMKYTASTIFHVSVQEPKILDNGAVGVTFNEFLIYQKSQTAMITSRLVLNAVLKDAEVAKLSILPGNPDAQIDWLQKELKVDFKTGPEFMKVSMVGYRPEEMKTLLNAIAAVYLKEVVYKERTRKQGRLNQLKEIQRKNEDTLRSLREAVRNLVLALGAGNDKAMEVKQRFAAEALGLEEKELHQVQSELRRLKIELKAMEGPEQALESQDRVEGHGGALGFAEKELHQVQSELRRLNIELKAMESQLEKAIDKEQVVAQLFAKWEHHKEELDRAIQKAVRGKNEPALRPKFDQLKTIEAELKAARDRVRPEVKERLLAQAGGHLRAPVAELRRRLEFSLELENSLQESVDRLRKQTISTNVGQADVESFRLEIAHAEKLSERVAAEVENLKVEVDAPRRVDLLEDASAGLGTLERQRTKATAGAGVAALLLVVGLIAWREYRYRRLDSAHELTHDLGIRVVGTLPVTRSPTRSLLPWRAAESDAWLDTLTESVDATRTSLLHIARENDTRVVLVTSARDGEGKTSLSCHLAGSLARAGFRTLLIDGDMRRPAIQRAFGITAREGLSELLRQQVELGPVVHETAIAGLWLIAAGQWNQSATSALARTRLPALLDMLREQYEYIIIDSAPLLPVVDSLLIGQHADGVILSVMREVSQLPLVNTAVERLESVGVRLLGVIVNGVAADVHAYRHVYIPDFSPHAAPSLSDPA